MGQGESDLNRIFYAYISERSVGVETGPDRARHYVVGGKLLTQEQVMQLPDFLKFQESYAAQQRSEATAPLSLDKVLRALDKGKKPGQK